MTLTQRSYGIGEGERKVLRATWEERFARLRDVLGREPGSQPIGGARSIEFERTLANVPRECVEGLHRSGLSGRLVLRLRRVHAPNRGIPFHFLWTSYGEQPGKVLEVESGERIRLAWDLPALRSTTEVALSFRPFAADRGKCRAELDRFGVGRRKGMGRRVERAPRARVAVGPRHARVLP